MAKKFERPEKLKAVAFDLDGTLYPNYRLYARLLPFVLREHRLLRAFGAARNELRAAKPGDPLFEMEFYDAQASLITRILNSKTGRAESSSMKDRVTESIYERWEPLFKNIKLFPFAKETLLALKEQGFKLGLLSDFPPERKLEYMGLSGLWDAAFCSEATGRLKPDSKPFLVLAEKLDASPEHILYVGNSKRYDIKGAKNAGMYAALKAPFFSSLLKKMKKTRSRAESADFIFYDYRSLYDYVIQCAIR